MQFSGAAETIVSRNMTQQYSFKRSALLFLQRVAEHRWSRAVRRGLLTCLPLVLLGAAAVFIHHLPIAAYQASMKALFGPNWTYFPDILWQASAGIIALAMVFAISHALAVEHPRSRACNLSPAVVPLIALASFLAVMHTDSLDTFMPLLGNRGAFAAICTALLSTEIFLWLRQSRVVPARWFSHDADPALPNALAALLPGALTVLCFLVLGMLLEVLSNTIGSRLGAVLQAPFADPENLGLGAVAMLLLIHVLWFFGVHGHVALDPLAQAHFGAARLSEAGAWIPKEVFSKTFYDVFIYQGGAGCTLALLIAVLLLRSHSNSWRLGKIALPCALINVNEPVLFGFPVVLNPFYLLPFVLTPLLLFVSGALVIASGLVPPPVTQVEWTTPPILGGWIATGSWRGAALQVFNLLIGVAIYLPFVRLAENARQLKMAEIFAALLEEAEKGGKAVHALLLRQDSVGNLARQLAVDLAQDVQAGRLSLAYQPFSDNKGRVLGVEALLRWTHAAHGPVPALLVVHLAEEQGLIHELGAWTIEEASRQLRAWRVEGLNDFRVSINVSPLQMANERLLVAVRSALADGQLAAQYLQLEITETTQLENSEAEQRNFQQLAELGVRLAMDDFGMGYSSMLYLRRFPIKTIKIGGALTRDVQQDKNCQEIIMSIAALCNAMGVEMLAGEVETREHMKLLFSLGCYVFQGSLFASALSPAECVSFIREKHAAKSA